VKNLRPRPTRVRVEADGAEARAIELTPGEFLTPRLLDRRGRHIRVALVGHTAMLLAGDRLDLTVEVGAGVHLELVEPSGTVAYNARGAAAAWSARIRVGRSGSLVWHAAPFVVAGGADVGRKLDLTLDHAAVAAVRETLVLGRHGEAGGMIHSRQRVTLDGAPLLVETLDLRNREIRELPGVLGPHRVVASAMLLGLDAGTQVSPVSTPLAGPGALARALTGAAHEADEILRATWSAWREEVARHTGTGVRQRAVDQSVRTRSLVGGAGSSGALRRTATITGISTDATIPAAKPLL
jgi:urease accessory protein